MFLAVGSVTLRLSNRAFALAVAYAVRSMAMKSTAMMPIGKQEQIRSTFVAGVRRHLDAFLKAFGSAIEFGDFDVQESRWPAGSR